MKQKAKQQRTIVAESNASHRAMAAVREQHNTKLNGFSPIENFFCCFRSF
jgi:hypothetical protein